jgi:hypothetical protein
MGQDLCDLGMTAAAVDARHQLAEPLRFGDPGRGAAFRQTAKIDKLDGEAADGGRVAEHFGLQHAGLIPCRLPAHGRIERVNEPAAPICFSRRAECIHAAEECVDPLLKRQPPESGRALPPGPAHG